MDLAATPSRGYPTIARVAPLRPAMSIDVVLMLVLLVAGVPLLARALSQAAPAPAAREVRLLVGQGGHFQLDGRALDRAQLDQALRQAQASSPDLRLLIATSDDNDYRGLLGALTAAEHAGVRNVASQVH